MKVSNMVSNSGNPVANQFIIEGVKHPEAGYSDVFQSYDSIIAAKPDEIGLDGVTCYLDQRYWDYSTTTGKYRNQFLGETKKETQAKIDSGEYVLTDLN